MSRKQLDLTPPTETLYCPVCKNILEYRERRESVSTHCDECRTSFHYAPHNPIPVSAMPDSMNKKRGCGCGHCSR